MASFLYVENETCKLYAGQHLASNLSSFLFFFCGILIETECLNFNFVVLRLVPMPNDVKEGNYVDGKQFEIKRGNGSPPFLIICSRIGGTQFNIRQTSTQTRAHHTC